MSLSSEKLQLTLFPRSEERVDEQSNVGVSQPAIHLHQCIFINARRKKLNDIE
ncbi:MAG: hypothetical protein JWR09_1956 [Mucilaginibacter sp.]|nr:hypothetical protein [Mucilaginibacter sp.]